MPEYLEVLIEKVSADRHPSLGLLDRIRRSRVYRFEHDRDDEPDREDEAAAEAERSRTESEPDSSNPS